MLRNLCGKLSQIGRGFLEPSRRDKKVKGQKKGITKVSALKSEIFLWLSKGWESLAQEAGWSSHVACFSETQSPPASCLSTLRAPLPFPFFFFFPFLPKKKKEMQDRAGAVFPKCFPQGPCCSIKFPLKWLCGKHSFLGHFPKEKEKKTIKNEIGK